MRRDCTSISTLREKRLFVGGGRGSEKRGSGYLGTGGRLDFHVLAGGVSRNRKHRNCNAPAMTNGRCRMQAPGRMGFIARFRSCTLSIHWNWLRLALSWKDVRQSSSSKALNGGFPVSCCFLRRSGPTMQADDAGGSTTWKLPLTSWR